MRLNYHFFLICLFVLGTGCDSTSTIEDPNKSYFIKFYGRDGDQTGQDMVVLPDGTFILFGTTTPSGSNQQSQWYLVKTDTRGTVMWEKKFGGPFNEEASDIELTNDGRLVIVGNSFKSPTDRDIFIMTLTLDGVKIDSTRVGFKNSANQDTDEDALSVSLTNDGFIVAGSSNNTDIKPNPVANDLRDAIHIRFYNNLLPYPNTWGKTDGPGTYDAALKVIEISPSQYYVFGYSNKVVPGHAKPDFNYWIFGLGVNGDPNTADLFIGDINDDEKLSSVSIAPLQSGDGYFLGGITVQSGATGVSDIYVSRLRKGLTFSSSDYQFQKPLSVRLGTKLPEKTSVFASLQSGFYVLANENSFNNDQNWILTKVNNDGSIAWTLPIVFGGEGLDTCGSVQELPDGRIVLIGTMRTGQPDVGEYKMALIKVNKEGKLLN